MSSTVKQSKAKGLPKAKSESKVKLKTSTSNADKPDSSVLAYVRSIASGEKSITSPLAPSSGTMPLALDSGKKPVPPIFDDLTGELSDEDEVKVVPRLVTVLSLPTPTKLPMIPGLGLSALRSSLSKQIRIRLATSLELKANGSGFVNAVVPVSNVSLISEFPVWAQLYAEFFVQHMVLLYIPQSTFGDWPTASTTATGQPLAVVNLHHGQAVPTLIATTVENPSLMYTHTSSKWKYTWKNIESKKGGVVVADTSTGSSPSQSWCSTASSPSSQYTGEVLMISPTNVGVGASMSMGNIVVVFDVYFRNRS
jgi:hypothetical protein